MIIRKNKDKATPILRIEKAEDKTAEVSKIAQALTAALQPRDGTDGIDGRQVELRKAENSLEWRHEDGDWQELLTLEEIKGDIGISGKDGIDGKQGNAGTDGKDGKDGKDGTDGKDGKDGETVDLRKSATHIQWKHENDTKWKNLVALEELRGPQGKQGMAGFGGGGGTAINGVPAGGTTGQVLAKNSNTNYDTEWVSGGGGGGGAVDSVNGAVGVVVLDTDDISDSGATNKYVTSAEKTKLAGIEAGAEVNNISDANATDLTDAGDSSLHFHSSDRNRANHTGTQLLSTISDVTASSAEVNILDGATLSTTELNYVDGVTSSIQTQINTKAIDADVVHDTGNETVGGIKTFTSDPLIPDEAYGVGWNGSLEPTTKNAVYDKIEAIEASDGDVIGPASSTDEAIARFDGTTGKLLQNSGVTISNTGSITVPADGKLFMSRTTNGSSIEITSNAPTGGLSGIKFYTTTEYDRNWLGWYDVNDRLRVMLGYHDKDYNSGNNHNQFEIKTSSDPTEINPLNMVTRFVIETDDEDVAAGFNVEGITLGTFMNDGTTARTYTYIKNNRQTLADTAGMILKLEAGAPTSGATDKAGGNLQLSSGISTGTARTGIEFWTAKSQASTSTTDNTPVIRGYMTNSGSGDNAMVMSLHNSTSLTGTPFSNAFIISGQNTGGLTAYRQGTANTAGNSMTVQASGATSGATDKAGGNILLKSGIATGSGSSSVIIQTPTASSGGGATSDNTYVSTLTVANTVITSLVDVVVPDEAYGVGWDSSLEVPTKNALYDKLEAIVLADGDVNGPASSTDNAVARFDGTTGKLIQNSVVTIADNGATVIQPTSTAVSLTLVSGTTETSTGLELRANTAEYGTEIVFWKHPTSTTTTDRLGQFTAHGNAVGSLVDELACYTTDTTGAMQNRYKVLANITDTPLILTGATGLARSSGNTITIGESVLGGGVSAVNFSSHVRTASYLRVGSTTIPTNTTAGDVTLTRLGISDNSAYSSGTILRSGGTMTATGSGAAYYWFIQPSITPASNSSADFRLLGFDGIWNPATGVTQTQLTAGMFQIRIRGDGLIGTIQGNQSSGMVVDSTSAATTQATNVYVYNGFIYARPSGTTTSTVTTGYVYNATVATTANVLTATTVYGYKFNNPAANPITSIYGINIDSITRGNTNSVGALIGYPGIGTGQTAEIGATSDAIAVKIPTASIAMGNQTATTTNAIGISVGIPTYSSTTNVRTITNSAGLYIAGAPVASTNVTITNGPYAIWVDDGSTRLDGALLLTSTGGTSATGITFGSDTTLYRTGANVLKTDGDIVVADEVYGVGWNGSLEVPTKNAVYDKIESVSGSAAAGGADTELQYNNGGSLGGIPELTYDDATGNIVFNEAGGDNDLRMEGDTNANLFFLDASTDKIGIKTATPDEALHVIGNFQIGDAAPSEGKGYRFRTSGSSLDLDFHTTALLVSGFDGPEYTGTQREKLVLKVGEDTSQLCGDWEVSLAPFGTAHHWFGSGALNGNFVVNEDSTASTFRVEGTNDANLITGNIVTDFVGIGNAAPDEKLHVTGNFKVSGTGLFGGDVTVPDEAYGVGWDSSNEVPTKNAVYDKIETLTGGGISESLAIAYAAAL
jgi:hypothetical protein